MENYINVNLLGAVHSSDEQVFIRRTAGMIRQATTSAIGRWREFAWYYWQMP
jgi:hypothetical protein